MSDKENGPRTEAISYYSIFAGSITHSYVWFILVGSAPISGDAPHHSIFAELKTAGVAFTLDERDFVKINSFGTRTLSIQLAAIDGDGTIIESG